MILIRSLVFAALSVNTQKVPIGDDLETSGPVAQEINKKSNGGKQDIKD
jgi:hypothetical protein